LVGSVVAWGSYFYFYERFKAHALSNSDAGRLDSSDHLRCAWQAGFLTATLTNPLWVVKTRMVLQTPDGVARYRNVAGALGAIWREEGVRGLFRGYLPAMIGVAHGAVQFSCYEYIKRLITRHKLEGDAAYFVAGGLSKLFATVVTYPYQVVRTRMQDRPPVGQVHRYATTWATVSLTWRAEGVRGFYRGIIPGALRVMPNTAIVFMTYEKVLKAINSSSSSSSV
jgi:solute carrier family 25 (mitochondrial folate transporter), member 32